MKGRDMALARDVALFHLVLIKPTHYDDEVIRSSGFGRPFHPTRWPASTAWRKTRDGGPYWDPMSVSGCTPLMKPIDGCIQRGSFATSNATVGGR